MASLIIRNPVPVCKGKFPLRRFSARDARRPNGSAKKRAEFAKRDYLFRFACAILYSYYYRQDGEGRRSGCAASVKGSSALRFSWPCC